MKAVVIGAVLCAAGGASAAVVSQVKSLSGTTAIATDPARPDTSQRVTTVPAGGFTGTFQPFNPALGTLTGVTITWAYDMSLEAFTAPRSTGFGGFAQFVGFGGGDGFGAFDVNGVQYGGRGLDGTGNGSGPPQPNGSTEDIRNGRFTLDIDGFTSSTTFDVPNLGADPRVVAALTGPTPYSVTWFTPERFDLQNIARGTVTRSASVTVDYTYNAIPEPAGLAAAAIAVAGLARRRRHR